MIGKALVALGAMFQAAPSTDRIDWDHPDNNPVRLRHNGFCTGLSWVPLHPGEVVTVDYGPDFNVYRVRGPGNREWGVYSGHAGQSQPGRQILSKDGVTVHRGNREGQKKEFAGYFVGKRNGLQNHFFGNVFRDAPVDSKFFARVRFGRVAKTQCAEGVQ